MRSRSSPLFSALLGAFLAFMFMPGTTTDVGASPGGGAAFDTDYVLDPADLETSGQPVTALADFGPDAAALNRMVAPVADAGLSGLYAVAHSPPTVLQKEPDEYEALGVAFLGLAILVGSYWMAKPAHANSHEIGRWRTGVSGIDRGCLPGGTGLESLAV